MLRKNKMGPMRMMMMRMMMMVVMMIMVMMMMVVVTTTILARTKKVQGTRGAKFKIIKRINTLKQMHIFFRLNKQLVFRSFSYLAKKWRA